jgi:hypothetical protein
VTGSCPPLNREDAGTVRSGSRAFVAVVIAGSRGAPVESVKAGKSARLFRGEARNLATGLQRCAPRGANRAKSCQVQSRISRLLFADGLQRTQSAHAEARMCPAGRLMPMCRRGVRTIRVTLASEPGRSARATSPVPSPHGPCTLGSECTPPADPNPVRPRTNGHEMSPSPAAFRPRALIDRPRVTAGGLPETLRARTATHRTCTRGEDPEGRDALLSDNTKVIGEPA